jgi:hypothetical protein
MVRKGAFYMAKAPNKFNGESANQSAIDAHNVNVLNDLDNDALHALWLEHFGRSPPFRARRSLLIDCLAYRIQEQAYGGLALSTRTRLRKLATDVIDGKKPVVLFQPTIKPGTRLIRAWGGQTHEVQVIEDGFTYRDLRYTNLSEIARVITGSRWSGPRFFGIVKPTKPSNEVHNDQ